MICEVGHGRNAASWIFEPKTSGFYKNCHKKELRVENDPTLFSHTN